jgi:hypothetical protein
MASEDPADGQRAALNAGAEAERRHDGANPPIPPVAVVSNPPPPPGHCEITVNTKRDGIDWWTLRLEGFGLLVLVIYTVFTGLMYCANKKAANAAQSAANTAASALHIDQRAWLSAWITNDPYKEQELMHLTLHIRNSGHTFAKNSTISRDVAVVFKGAEPKPEDWQNGLTVAAGLIPPGVGETWTNEIHSSEKLDKTLSDALRDGTRIIYVRGRIDFDDIFPDSHRHWVSFCFRSRDAADWLTCSTGNDIDPY